MFLFLHLRNMFQNLRANLTTLGKNDNIPLLLSTIISFQHKG
jgi:hypothetical protein